MAEDKLWVDCSQVQSLGLILSSTTMERQQPQLNAEDIQAQIDALATQYEAILKTYQAIQENFAAVATDIAKVKRALHIDVPPPPASAPAKGPAGATPLKG